MNRMILLAACLAAPGAAQVQGGGQGDVSVTIYNDDLALVQDIRSVALPAGVSRQEFPDVSTSIRPETVSLAGDGFDVVEQNFDFDLLSPTALMQKAIGQTITLLRTNPATGAETRERATVLAVNGGAVLRIGDRIEVLRDDGLPVRVIFDTIPPNLRARPTLSITVDAARAGTRALTLSYLSTGLSWKADYVALFDERAGKIDVEGWITLTNSSGTAFVNAATLLVAGEVAQVNRPRARIEAEERRSGTMPGIEAAARPRIGDFYVYPLAGRTTIASAQTKQVSFLDAAGAPAARGYEYRNAWLGRSRDPQSAATMLKFSSAREGGLGDALPAGIVRVYMRDGSGQPQFVGESEIPHTPMGSSLNLRTGNAFDVKVRPTVEKRERVTPEEWETTARYRVTGPDGVVTTTQVDNQRERWRTTMRYVVSNARSQPVTVDLFQDGLGDWWDVRVVSESLAGRQVSAYSRLWEVPVAANGETVVTAVFETRY